MDMVGQLVRLPYALEKIARETGAHFGVAIDVVGFVAFDLDCYSSTVKALRLFEGPAATHLPRVHCYFDDIVGPEFACMNDHVGELLAIDEFNAAHAPGKICQIRNLRCARKRDEPWYAQIYAFHDFDHPRYADNVALRQESWRQLPI